MKRTILVATVVLALAFTGGAFASGHLTGRDIKNGTLTGRDIKDHSIGASKLKAFPSPVATAATAPTVTRVTSTKVPVAAHQSLTQRAYCPAGTTVVGGGFETSGGGEVTLSSNLGSGNNLWAVGLTNPGTTTVYLAAVAYCLS